MARAIDLDKAIEIIEEKQKELCPVGRYGRNYVYGSDRENMMIGKKLLMLWSICPPSPRRTSR